MKVVFNCVVCGSANVSKRIGQFAPFIAHRMFDYPVCKLKFGDAWFPPMLLTNSLRCSSCGFVFSQLRPDTDELGRLYRGYRGPEYAENRTQFEPGYAALHPFVGDGAIEIERRQAAARDFLAGLVDPASIKRVLDYGGDKGQHIPSAFNASERYVYEISGVEAMPGVKVVNSLREAGDVDFVMAANVLEHVSYPLDLMQELRTVCHKDTFVFIDVPLEMDDSDDVAPANVPTAFHEHINYFTTRSLTALIKCSGFTPLKIERLALDFGWVKVHALYALARQDW